jgi:aminopeptidase N
LYNLWNNFPKYRSQYLDKSKNWIGFNDKNLRILWLSLAVSTQGYSMNNEILISELMDYSSSNFEATIRQNALEKLIAFHLINDTVAKNLVNATTHHLWQFSKFGKDKIRLLLKNPNIRTYLEQLLPNLSKEENLILSKILNEKPSN